MSTTSTASKPSTTAASKKSTVAKTETHGKENVAPATTEVKKETKPKATKSKAEPKTLGNETKTAASATEPSTATEPDSARNPRQRRVVTKESIDASFMTIIEELVSAIELARENPKFGKIATKLKKVLRDQKTLQSDTARVVKLKPKSNRSSNTQCGFKKPKAITKELADFTGWNPQDLKSSVDATNFICKYIKDNNLSQTCPDRRQFVPDTKLHALFEHNPQYDRKDKQFNMLSYPLIQRYIQIHFPKPQEKPQVTN